MAKPDRETVHLLTAPIEVGSEDIVGNETIDELLEGLPWSCERRRVGRSTAYAFSRPVNLLESMRVDPAAYRDQRHILGITQPNGEQFLTYVAMHQVHAEDLRTLARIEAELAGHGAVTRADFTDKELPFVDRVWLGHATIREELGMSKGGIDAGFTDILRRWRLRNRTELLIFGLTQGFLNPRLEDWRGPWGPLSPRRSAAMRRAHHTTTEVAAEFGITEHGVNDIYEACYRITGLENRPQLVLGALANGECALADLRPPERKIKLSETDRQMLGLVDKPYAEVTKVTKAQKSTISNRYQRICEVLGYDTREQLTVYAFRKGYIENGIDPRLADIFTPRQREVAGLSPHDNDEIAEILGISRSVVDHHVTEAQRRIGVFWRPALVAYGLRAGLISPQEFPVG